MWLKFPSSRLIQLNSLTKLSFREESDLPKEKVLYLFILVYAHEYLSLLKEQYHAVGTGQHSIYTDQDEYFLHDVHIQNKDHFYGKKKKKSTIFLEVKFWFTVRDENKQTIIHITTQLHSNRHFSYWNILYKVCGPTASTHMKVSFHFSARRLHNPDLMSRNGL